MIEATLESQECLETPEETQPAEETAEAEEEIEQRPERNMGARSSRVALRLMARICLHADERKLGKTFGSDCGYHLPGDQIKKVRFPDGSFVVSSRLPGEGTPDGNLKLAPDLAVEVVSPNDTAYEVEEKRAAYQAARVPLVWIVYPPTRTIFVFRPSGVSILGESDTLSGEAVLPDFTCPVARFFEDL